MEPITNRLFSTAINFSRRVPRNVSPTRKYHNGNHINEDGRGKAKGNTTPLAWPHYSHGYNSSDQSCKDWAINQGKDYSTSNLSLMQSPYGINLQCTKEVLDWMEEIEAAEERHDQVYDKKRVEILGPDSAAAQFFTDRMASIRLKGPDEDWIVGGMPTLTHYVAGYFVKTKFQDKTRQIEAVDCKNFRHSGIRFEGLRYLDGLKGLKWLSLKNQKLIDVHCLDRIAGQNGKTVEYLDLSGVHINYGCVVALSKMTALQHLVVSEATVDSAARYALLRLHHQKPNLRIRWISKRHSRPLQMSSNLGPNHPSRSDSRQGQGGKVCAEME